MGPRGAHVVVVQPDPTREELLRPFADILQRTTHREDGSMAAQASRLARELEMPDDLSTLAAEGIVLELLVSLARLDRKPARRPPAWLLRAQELLHAHFAEPIRTTEVADAVGVSKAHIWELEKGRADNPSMSLVTRLADHFGVSVASLVGEDLLAGDADPAIARMFRQAGELEPEDLAFLDEMMQSLLRRRRKSGAGV